MRLVEDGGEAARLRAAGDAGRAELHRRVAEPEFPLYGLPASWSGVRVLQGGSWDHRGGRIVGLTTVELAHVAPPGQYYDAEHVTARLVVTCGVESAGRLPGAVPGSPPGREPDRGQHEAGSGGLDPGLARDLRAALDLPAFPEGTSREERRRWLVDPALSLAAAARPVTATVVELPVDGTPVAFRALASGAVWAAVAALGSLSVARPGERVDLVRTVRVRAHRWSVGDVAAVGLAAVADVTPYVAGWEALEPPVDPTVDPTADPDRDRSDREGE